MTRSTTLPRERFDILVTGALEGARTKPYIPRAVIVRARQSGDLTLANAWPTKITGTDLKSDGNEVSIESIEIVHEGLTIDNG